jgi:hypothetical protein
LKYALAEHYFDAPLPTFVTSQQANAGAGPAVEGGAGDNGDQASDVDEGRRGQGGFSSISTETGVEVVDVSGLGQQSTAAVDSTRAKDKTRHPYILILNNP